MSRTKPIQIQIPHPCLQSWDEMTSVDQGRFCAHCQKKVTDFTEWSDAALYSFFSKNTDSACGRFLSSQVSRTLNIPYQPHSRLYRLTIALGLTLIVPPHIVHGQKYKSNITYTLLSDSELESRWIPPIEEVFPENDNSDYYDLLSGVKGQITNNKLPIQYASIHISKDGNLIRSTITDKDGRYKILPLEPGCYDILFFASGFDSVQINNFIVAPNKMAIQDVFLQIPHLRYQMGICDAPGIPAKDSYDFENIKKRNTPLP